MLLASFAEILSIGSVIPFLGVLMSPERIFELSAAQPIIRALNLTEPKQLLLPLAIIFAAAALFAGILRIALLWVSTRLSFATGSDFSNSIYLRTLYQPYMIHCSRNSSEVIDGISGKADGIIYNIIVPALTLISSITILVAILITMLLIQPVIAFVAFGGFGLVYLVIILLTRKRLMVDGICAARESTQVIKSLQEGLGGIRDILIDGSQATYCGFYRNADLRLRRAQGNSLFISACPRYGMEALGMIIIATLAYAFTQQVGGIANAIPILGAIALGAQRLLPMLQQAYSSWSRIKSGQSSLRDALELLDQPLPDYASKLVAQPLPFKNKISIKQLSFRYSSQMPYVLKQVDLTIEKGSRIGFIGETGSGKSTLLDIIMGLLQPSEGAVEIDGQKILPANIRAWQARIAHVPQVIFLADSTIEENIAFGVPHEQIDQLRVRQAAYQAQIADIIESWPMQYQTAVGERGIRLSGGQRQRIGIARALYKNSEVIIFDEATNALDHETEESVMRAIESLGKNLTILIIAHRLTTLKNCTKIVEIANGKIVNAGSYHNLIKPNLEE
jgi:ATP-binding cassette subfamily B protein